MKKLLIIIGLGLLLAGCEPKTTTTYSDESNPELKPNMVIHFTYEGHRYILFKWDAEGYDSKAGYVHDPDCLLEDLRKEKENRELI